MCLQCVQLLTIFSCRPAKLLTTINSPTGLSRPRLHHVVGQRLRAFLCHTKTNDSFYAWRWHMVYGLILLFGLTGTTPHARAHCTGTVLAYIILLCPSVFAYYYCYSITLLFFFLVRVTNFRKFKTF